MKDQPAIPSVSALVVATSSGAPMRSERPKPIHLLCGRPMLSYVLDNLGSLGVRHAVVVTGASGDWISKRILEDPPDFSVRFVEHSSVEQTGGRGNATAALMGLTGFDDFDDDADLLILPADLPLMRTETLVAILDQHRTSGAACTIATEQVADVGQRPRIERDRHGRVQGIVRAQERLFPAADGERAEGEAGEIPLGVYCVRRGLLAPAIRRILPDRINGDHQLLDMPGVLADSGHPVVTAVVSSPEDLVPVDNRLQLAEAEAKLRQRTNRYWMSRGVTMIDPERTYVDTTVTIGTDVTLFPGVILRGATTISDGCEIGPDTRLDHCTVGTNSVVDKTVAQLATIGDGCRVGPFAALEAGAEIPDGTVTGPFYAASSGD